MSIADDAILPVAIDVDQLARQVVYDIERTRTVLSDEKVVQQELAFQLERLGYKLTREVALSASDVVDFVIEGGLAVEVKIKGQKRSIFRQCERYCQHDAIQGLVLVSAKTMGFPQMIKGKPCYFASLSIGWL